MEEVKIKIKSISEISFEIVDKSYELFVQKIVNGSLSFKNEASMQLELAYILKTLGQLYEFRKEDDFKVLLEETLPFNEKDAPKARVDIMLEYNSGKEKPFQVAIELKFLKKINHREPNNRYDVFNDLLYLEKYKEAGIHHGYFILVTDHDHYVNQGKYSDNTADFDFRDGKEYHAGEVLEYKTKKPHGEPIKLAGNHKFQWEKYESLYFFKIKI